MTKHFERKDRTNITHYTQKINCGSSSGTEKLFSRLGSEILASNSAHVWKSFGALPHASLLVIFIIVAASKCLLSISSSKDLELTVITKSIFFMSFNPIM